jgi:hypothetical protein
MTLMMRTGFLKDCDAFVTSNSVDVLTIKINREVEEGWAHSKKRGS